MDPHLQNGFKIPRWEPRSHQGIYLGISPLHASTVGLILNPRTNRISPQFHCVYDDHFETVHSHDNKTPPIWEDLVINNRFRNEIDDDDDIEDTWNPKETSTTDKGDDGSADKPPSPTPLGQPKPSDEMRVPPTPPVDVDPAPRAADTPPDNEPEDRDPTRESGPRRSTRIRKPVDRFTPDKAHGYHTVQRYTNALIGCICAFYSVRNIHDVNYATALAMDPVFGHLDSYTQPDMLTRNPWMFKSKKMADPDTPSIKEALSGPFRDEFLESMQLEITELDEHKTWEVIQRKDIPTTKLPNGAVGKHPITPTTWAYKLK